MRYRFPQRMACRMSQCRLHCKNKLDVLIKKAKAAYAKDKLLTQSGVQVVDPGDLEASGCAFIGTCIFSECFCSCNECDRSQSQDSCQP